MSLFFSKDVKENTALLRQLLRVSASFDIVLRDVAVADLAAAIVFVDGFVKDETMSKMLQFFVNLQPEKVKKLKTPEDFASHFVPYTEVAVSDQPDEAVTAVLSGQLALLVDGYDKVILVDLRTYPVRGVSEPESDRVLRGSHDGFVETLVFNTALIRRHLRDARLTMEYRQIGSVSKTDVVMCYLDGVAPSKHVKTLRDKLEKITIPSLTMGQESLVECLFRKQQWYNPFPKVRYTERPDAAAAAVSEGRILIIVDGTPVVMILPSGIFDFVQDTNDYYFPPLVGSYLRLVRILVFGFTIFVTPVWFLLITNPDWIPSWLEFIRIKEPNTVPVIIQLLMVEVIIDAIRLASLNTPSALNNAFGVVGALILGEFAVTAGLFVAEVLLYMAAVAVATFTQPSFELGYAFKLSRMLFLVLTALFGVWGFIGGILLVLLVLATTQTALGTGYLYPVVPFDKVALRRLLVRRILHRNNALRK
ncbi:MAG: spore germination protein [Ruminococcaceae bacterium]|nr:spore germination protein [Oscillospiraceae bacterium]